MGTKPRIALLLAVACVAGILLWRHGPIPQPEDYHRFADARTLAGIPNAHDVLSNVPFFVVGAAGLAFLGRKGREAFVSTKELPAYVVFFTGVLLTAFGSGYYHLEPTTPRLFWDRLPMTLGFTALFAAVIAERISLRWSRLLLVPFVLAGVASVVAWRLSEERGAGDLRVYLFVQLFPMLALPLMMLLFRPRYSRSGELFVVVLVYAAAKALEHFDVAVWRATGGVVSGHALKHVVAAAATAFVLDMIAKRRPLPV